LWASLDAAGAFWVYIQITSRRPILAPQPFENEYEIA